MVMVLVLPHGDDLLVVVVLGPAGLGSEAHAGGGWRWGLARRSDTVTRWYGL